MIIVDNALREREAEQRPIRVGMIGSGFMAQGLANQIMNSVPGMQMTAVYGRRLERAIDVYRYAGLDDTVVATTQDELEDAVRAGRPVATDDATSWPAPSRSTRWSTSPGQSSSARALRSRRSVTGST